MAKNFSMREIFGLCPRCRQTGQGKNIGLPRLKRLAEDARIIALNVKKDF